MAASGSKAEPASEKQGVHEFMVTVSLAGGKAGKKRLGVDADWADGKTLYIKAVLWGAVEDWNKEHGPDEAVRAGDRIIAVNGCAGDAQAMVQECRDRTLLQLLIRRAESSPLEPEADTSATGAGTGPPERPFSGFLPGVQLAGEFVPGVTPPRVLDVLLDLRRRQHSEPAAACMRGADGMGQLPPPRVQPMADAPDHYKVLGLNSRLADETEVKKCYRRLVLQWHPDKHPADREEAEERIRLINDAYETLGNPTKRAAYDQMLAAVERKKAGVRLETGFIKPRMSIPKEFMLCPMGYPDRFVRVDEQQNLCVQSRDDVPAVSFKDFFQSAKFTLWWLPEDCIVKVWDTDLRCKASVPCGAPPRARHRPPPPLRITSSATAAPSRR